MSELTSIVSSQSFPKRFASRVCERVVLSERGHKEVFAERAVATKMEKMEKEETKYYFHLVGSNSKM